MLSENDEQLQSNGGSDGVRYLIGPMDSGQPAQSSNSGSATGTKLSARDSGQLPQSSDVGTVGYMRLSSTQPQPGLGDGEYMELDKGSQLHASCEARLNIDRKIPNQAESAGDTYQPLLQQSKQPNNDGYMKVDKHTSCFATPQSTDKLVYEATQV